MTAPSRPALRRSDDASREARVEYRLLRDAAVRDVERGRLAKVDACDAHPELLRAARHVGTAAGEACPLCGSDRNAVVRFVFGPGLPPGGRCPGSQKELKRLLRGDRPVVCFEVEVCPDCSWHHLLRRYPAGEEGQHATSGSRGTSGARR